MLANEDIEAHWWIEVDLATEHAPAIRRKAQQYFDYYRLGIEQRRSGIFPRVAWLATATERINTLRNTITGTVPDTPELFTFGLLASTLDTLRPAGGAP